MSDTIERLNTALGDRYTIERELGEGGMATVYLADDLKHERKVALKVLKPELAAVVGAERFLAEIKTTANLTHPNILPLFDSGEADSFLYYVMPFIEGESLRDRLDREHQLPVDEAVKITTDLAEALDYAHRNKIIHLDIKPANIMLQDGKPVISAFGIALAVGAGGGGRLTETGLSLGTPHYMSPEQATGDLHVGAATDIYALGCVLFEMLVGDPPFTGSTPQAVLGKIVAGEAPSVRAERASVPPNVDAVVIRALERVPADRFPFGAQMAGALANPGFRHGSRRLIPSSDTRWRRIALGLAAVTATLLSIEVWSILTEGERLEDTHVMLTITPPSEVAIDANRGLAIAPDEQSVVFFDAESRQLYRRALDRLGVRCAVGLEGADVECPVSAGGRQSVLCTIYVDNTYFSKNKDALPRPQRVSFEVSSS